MMAMQLEVRDRRALIAAGCILLAVVVYLGVIDPLQSRLAGARDAVAASYQVLTRIRQIADQAAELRSDGAVSAPGMAPDSRSILAVVDDSARSAGVSSAISEMTPGNHNTVRVTIGKVGFDAMLGWLIQLDHGHGIHVVKISVAGADEPGYVQSTITLQSRQQDGVDDTGRPRH